MVIFEIHSFTHSFTCAVHGSVATHCTGQAASGVNYCYLVVWGSITGTPPNPPLPAGEQTPRGLFLLAYIFRQYWSQKKEKKSLRKLLSSLLPSSQTDEAQKLADGSFYSSLFIMNKTPNEGTSFRWRTFRVFVAPEDFWHFFSNSHIFFVLLLFMWRQLTAKWRDLFNVMALKTLKLHVIYLWT